MSRSYACNQFERNYSAVRLCNWEVPANRAKPLRPTSAMPPGKTEFIVSDNGHLIGRKVAQHGQRAPLAGPQLGPCASSGRAWHLWAAWGRAGPPGAQPLPYVLQPAASKAAHSPAFDHLGGGLLRHGLRCHAD